MYLHHIHSSAILIFFHHSKKKKKIKITIHEYWRLMLFRLPLRTLQAKSDVTQLFFLNSKMRIIIGSKYMNSPVSQKYHVFVDIPTTTHIEVCTHVPYPISRFTQRLLIPGTVTIMHRYLRKAFIKEQLSLLLDH